MNRTLTGMVLMSAAAGALAQGAAPPDYIAAPDVYKVVAENDQYRMVEAVWKPGQRDAFHSHPVMLYYYATPCSLRFYLPDGNSVEGSLEAGRAGSHEAPFPSHSVENVGSAECRVVLIEPK